MAEPEFSLQSKSKEGEENTHEEESEESDYSIGYDSNDPSFEILEGKADRKIWEQYYREWDESEGLDISVHPGCFSMAGIEQLHDYVTDPKIKQEYTELCKLAIHDFNSKNKKKKKCQQDRETITEGELDKPSLVKSFVSGLVIERANQVGIRYTGKLKENGKILGTNIGEGEPLEFRIASGQLVQGWEIGVNDHLLR
ncbi:FK506-binding protein 4-like [Solanum tuberosum]|uniref:FK506-binding protein 4-like n=1 Tax=Solanum tuberosum TaxID=4113 RepID=UPI00073A393B|nr:PREDICTED: FK506-binding protein 4-like [Solanum tuberosum]